MSCELVGGIPGYPLGVVPCIPKYPPSVMPWHATRQEVPATGYRLKAQGSKLKAQGS
mgnify:CR=1 FL=1